jgi:predicted SAM-dependent methyltransferase
LERQNGDGVPLVTDKHLQVNIGCGQSPTLGWVNFDNSPSIWLARHPVYFSFLTALGILQKPQIDFVHFAKNSSLRFADATKKIPLASKSVATLYASHMLEHLDRQEARRFLAEAMRVLRPGGVIRLVVPDLHILVQRYLKEGSANDFVEGTYLTQEKVRGLKRRLLFLMAGGRLHHWMYDGYSLCGLLSEAGFGRPQVMHAGETRISSPGALDLRERESESVYVEAIRP